MTSTAIAATSRRRRRPGVVALVGLLVALLGGVLPAGAAADQPVVTWPTPGAEVDPGLVTFAGTASADDVVARVDLSVFDLDDRTYLRSDGSFQPGWSVLFADLDTAAATTSWSYVADLEPGRYRLGARARDGAHAISPNASVDFVVVDPGAPVDAGPPTVDLLSPSLSPDLRTDVEVGPLEVTVRITDDLEVRELRWALKDQGAGSWLRPDGTWGGWAQMDATLLGAGAVVDATLTAELPPADLLLVLYAFDQAGNRTRVDRRLRAVVPAPALPPIAHGGLVPDMPRTDTLRVVDGVVDALDQAGDTVVVGGDFDTIRLLDGTLVTQRNLTAYDVDTGAELAGFRPQLNGVVNGVVGLPDGSFVVGGAFTTVDGQERRKIARFLPDGTLDPAFSPRFSGNVESVAYAGGRLFVAGNFGWAGGKRRELVAMLDWTTGAVLDGLSATFAEGISVGGYCNANAALPNADGTSVLVVHSCRKVNDQLRTIVARFDEVDGVFELSDWTVPIFEDERAVTGGQIPIRKGAVSPDFSYAVVTTKGGDKPPLGDVALAFPLAGDGPVEPLWITRNHDSAYSVAISDAAVIVGGHFQYTEGPQAPDPWPGDDTTNYGWGRSEGARVLGGQALRRHQVAALDPATGHALPWNPGANGQEAVTELTVTPRGLLLGHDGTSIAGLGVGRHGFFDLARLPAVPPEPTVTVASPQRFLEMTAGPVHVDGRATPAADVTRVEVEAVAGDGRTIPAADADLAAAPVSGARAWQLTIPFEAGEWTIRSRAWVGVTPGPWAERVLQVVGEIGDEPPDAVFSSPLAQALDPGPTPFEGWAYDDVGVASMALVVQDQDTNAYLRPDGVLTTTFSTWPATLSNPDAVSTAWSAVIDLPEGEWRVALRPTDVTGLQPNSGRQRQYVVSLGAAAPDVVITAGPDHQSTISDRTPTFTVTADDDRAVNEIEVRVAQAIPDSLFWEASTGQFVGGNARWFPIPATGIGTPSASAQLTLPELPYGRWLVRFRAVDDQGLVASFDERNFVVVVDGDDPPEADVTSLTYNQTGFTELVVPISGVATDDNAIASVQMSVRGQELALGGGPLWLQPDGSWQELKALVDLPVTSGLGTPSATFDMTLTVPAEAAYDIYVYPRDDAGQPNNRLRWNEESVKVNVFPGDELPVVVLDNPSPGAVLTGTSISMNGSATDDHQLTRVQAYVRNRDTGEGPRVDGSWGAPQWVDVSAFNNPGQDRTQWSHLTPDGLPPGRYSVRARVIDNRSQVSAVVIHDVELVAP